jgi:hypothetical protein
VTRECPYVLGKWDLSRVPVSPAGRASRRCNCLILVRSLLRCSTIRTLCRLRAWFRWWLWPGRRVCASWPMSTWATDKGANAGLKVTSLVAGMVAGADSIDDAVVRNAKVEPCRQVFACWFYVLEDGEHVARDSYACQRVSVGAQTPLAALRLSRQLLGALACDRIASGRRAHRGPPASDAPGTATQIGLCRQQDRANR